jgi:hypothetical protein
MMLPAWCPCAGGGDALGGLKGKAVQPPSKAGTSAAAGASSSHSYQQDPLFLVFKVRLLCVLEASVARAASADQGVAVAPGRSPTTGLGELLIHEAAAPAEVLGAAAGSPGTLQAAPFFCWVCGAGCHTVAELGLLITRCLALENAQPRIGCGCGCGVACTNHVAVLFFTPQLEFLVACRTPRWSASIQTGATPGNPRCGCGWTPCLPS